MTTPSFYGIGPANTQQAYLPSEFQFPEEEKMFRELLSKRERLTATCLNLREIAQYETSELLTGQQWFSTTPVNQVSQKRYTFRKVINFGALPNNTTKSVAHGLTLDDGSNPSTWFFTKIYATAYDPSVGAEKIISIPYYDISAGAVANPININGDETDVNITTTSNRTNFTRCYVVLEYIKNF